MISVDKKIFDICMEKMPPISSTPWMDVVADIKWKVEEQTQSWAYIGDEVMEQINET